MIRDNYIKQVIGIVTTAEMDSRPNIFGLPSKGLRIRKLFVTQDEAQVLTEIFTDARYTPTFNDVVIHGQISNDEEVDTIYRTSLVLIREKIDIQTII